MPWTKDYWVMPVLLWKLFWLWYPISWYGFFSYFFICSCPLHLWNSNMLWWPVLLPVLFFKLYNGSICVSRSVWARIMRFMVDWPLCLFYWCGYSWVGVSFCGERSCVILCATAISCTGMQWMRIINGWITLKWRCGCCDIFPICIFMDKEVLRWLWFVKDSEWVPVKSE